MLYLLILGAFINIVVAWIFDITPEGVQKTKPITEIQESDKSFLGQAGRYLSVGNYDKAMDYYDKAYEERNVRLAYVSLFVIDFPELKDNPRYIEFLKKMNLPLPKD